MRRGDTNVPFHRAVPWRTGSLCGSSLAAAETGGLRLELRRGVELWIGTSGSGHSRPPRTRLSTIRIVGGQWMTEAFPSGLRGVPASPTFPPLFSLGGGVDSPPGPQRASMGG